MDLLAEAVRRVRTGRWPSCSRSESTQSPPQRTDSRLNGGRVNASSRSQPVNFSARGKLLSRGIDHVPGRVLPRLLLLRSSSLSCNFSSCTPGSSTPPPLRHLRQVGTKLRYHVCGTRVRPHSAPFFCDEVRTACPSCPRCRGAAGGGPRLWNTGGRRSAPSQRRWQLGAAAAPR